MMASQLKVLLIDDEKICIDIIKSQLLSYDYVNIVGEFTDSKDVIKFLQNNEIDLIFLDIEMPDINGFELASHIKARYPNIQFIFVTGHTGFALNGYEYQPIDFLIKPINLLRLDKAMARVNELIYGKKAKKRTRIGIQVSGGLEIINVDDILYIEKRGRKICIVCKNNEIYSSKDSLQKLEVLFKDFEFYRIHQSFLVPLDKIKSVHRDDLKRSYNVSVTDVKELLPLCRDNYDELKEILLEKGIKIY